MFKKLSVLVTWLVLIVINQTAMGSDSVSNTKKNYIQEGTGKTVQKLTKRKTMKTADTYRYEFVTGPIHAVGTLHITIMNNSANRIEQFTLEIAAGGFIARMPIISGPFRESPDKMKISSRTEMSLAPGKIYSHTFRQWENDNPPSGNVMFRIKIKVSSQDVIPQMVHLVHVTGSPSFDLVREFYSPSDFAVYSLKPYKRIK